MKAIVFGGSGFVGSHIADALSDVGHEVTVFDLRSSSYLRPNQKFVQGDILQPQQVDKAIQGMDFVYNCAGLADLDQARLKPLETIQSNVLGNGHLLEASHQAGVKRFIFASTIYVYSESGSFYRASKQACELYIEEYQRQFGLDYTILRFGSLYGPRANESNSVYRYLKQALENRRIVGYGSGDEVREYIHVQDAARLSVQILSSEYRNQHVILTGHHRLRFRDLLQMVQEIVGPDVSIELRSPKSSDIAPGTYAHYTITPYNFRPKIGKKLLNHHYMDMGQGLLECLEHIHAKKHKLQEISLGEDA